jgi:hypothetical protein
MSSSLVAAVLVRVSEDGGDWGQVRADHVAGLADRGVFGADEALVAVRTLLTQEAVEPARIVRVLEQHPQTLPVLWPLLTEPIRVAGAATGPLPRWANRVLDVALLLAEPLREGIAHGRLSDASGIPGLAQIAARPGRAAAPVKARTLLQALGLDLVPALTDPEPR